MTPEPPRTALTPMLIAKPGIGRGTGGNGRRAELRHRQRHHIRRLRLKRLGNQQPTVKLVVSSAVESPPAKTSIVVVSITQSRLTAFQ